MVKLIREKKKFDKDIAIAIKKNYESGMKPKDISALFNLSKQTVNYWIHHPIIKKRKRRGKLIRYERNYIIKWAKDKPLNLVSAKKIQSRFNSLCKSKKENKLQKKISISTANRILNKYLSKPKKVKKVFFLSASNKEERLRFLKFMEKNGIGPEHIFFTDESIFNVSSYFNGNYKIRLSKQTEKEIKRGKENSMNKVYRQFHKKEKGVMVSGGICENGLGKLIFHSGNVNSFAYKQTLQFYKEDMETYRDKYFQQDGAKAHSSKISQKELIRLFGDNFIPTWEKGPKINGEYIPKWPPNSPDLSGIELIWSVIKGMMSIFPPKNLEELKNLIKKIWDSIPPEMCKRIIDHMKKRWNLCILHKGRRLDKHLLRKISTTKRKQLKLKISKSTISGMRISYNDKFVLRLKKRDIKERMKKLKEQKEIEKEKLNILNRLKKLKPKDYKNIPEHEKNEIKFNYEHEKAKRELMEENLEELKKRAL